MFERAIDEHTTIREISVGDADELFALVDAERARLREWLPWVDAMTESEHETQFIASAVKQSRAGLGFICVVVHRGRIVGTVGYHPIDRVGKSAEIGYWLSREAVGNGIITRACRILVDHAFRELGVERVVIPAAVGNGRSRAVPERLGFGSEGITPKAEWLYDHWVDHVRYSMSAGDWREREETP